MAVSLLHFGADECHRVLVLRRAGYEVNTCLSLRDLRSALKEKGDADAVLVAGISGTDRGRIVTITRSLSQARLILFGVTYERERKFDLVISPLVDPEEWLPKVGLLIEQSRALNAIGRAIRDDAERAIQDAHALVRSSRLERERALQHSIRAKRLMVHILKGWDSAG